MSRMTAFLCRPCAAAWPTCRCTSTSTDTAKCKMVATPGLGNRCFKTRWFCRWWWVETSHNHTLTSLCFFSFGQWITASDSYYQSRRRSMVLLRSISPKLGSEGFILIFDVPSPKCFAQPGDHHSSQASNTGSALKKRKVIFKHNSRS